MTTTFKDILKDVPTALRTMSAGIKELEQGFHYRRGEFCERQSMNGGNIFFVNAAACTAMHATGKIIHKDNYHSFYLCANMFGVDISDLKRFITVMFYAEIGQPHLLFEYIDGKCNWDYQDAWSDAKRDGGNILRVANQIGERQ